MALRRYIASPGDRYGSLTVIREVESIDHKGYKNRMVLCHCDCGDEKVVRFEYLRSGHTKSCGCLVKDILMVTRTTHGAYKTRLYRVWNGMKNRCRNKNIKSYKTYGARGIRVCDEWQNFEAFRDWALSNSYQDDLTIERKDNNGNYEPGNCTWIPFEQQARNKTNNRYVTYNGETKVLVEWAEQLGIDYDILQGRLAGGWSVERAFTQRVRRSPKVRQ